MMLTSATGFSKINLLVMPEMVSVTDTYALSPLFIYFFGIWFSALVSLISKKKMCIYNLLLNINH